MQFEKTNELFEALSLAALSVGRASNQNQANRKAVGFPQGGRQSRELISDGPLTRAPANCQFFLSLFGEPDEILALED